MSRPGRRLGIGTTLLLHGTRYGALPVPKLRRSSVQPRLPCCRCMTVTSCRARWLSACTATTNSIRGASAALLSNALIALCFTADNGATVVPGSSLASDAAIPENRSRSAGRRVDQNGSLWHTATRTTDAPRPALTINFCVGFVRQHQVRQSTAVHPAKLVRCFEPRLQGN